MLLRDVALEKMLEAIQDGTFRPGERLNDPEISAWLGLSRTPVREAVAKLVQYGLVDMEANRFTRVAVPHADDLVERVQVILGIGELLARDAFPKLTGTDVKALQAQTKKLSHDAPSGVHAAISAAVDLVYWTAKFAGRPLLSALAAQVGEGARFQNAAIAAVRMSGSIAVSIDQKFKLASTTGR